MISTPRLPTQGPLPPLARAWDQWFAPGGPPPAAALADADGALKGLGRYASLTDGPAAALPGLRLATRVDASLDAQHTRGGKSFNKPVFAPDRMSSANAPVLPAPQFVIGALTRPRSA